MKNVLEYLIYCVPLVFIIMSRIYLSKYRKLEGTGKIPDIVSAQNNQKLFFALSVITAFIIIIFV